MGGVDYGCGNTGANTNVEGGEVGRDCAVLIVARMVNSAYCSNHSMALSSDLCPSSRVSWNTRTAHGVDICILLPWPSTFVCWSFDGRFGDTTADGVAGATALIKYRGEDYGGDERTRSSQGIWCNLAAWGSAGLKRVISRGQNGKNKG